LEATYANCFVGPTQLRGRLLTDEISVAAATPAGMRTDILDSLIDPDRAHALNIALWERAFSWFREDDHDPTVIDGISVGDIAGSEAALTIFLPAARGVLEAQALPDAADIDRLTLAVASGGPGNYSRVETIQSEAFAAALGLRASVDRVVSHDQRNGILFAKFERTRDPAFLAREPWARVSARNLVVGAANLRGSLTRSRSRNALAVLEYNPTRSFARAYAADPSRSLRLVRIAPDPGDLLNVFRAGDRALIPAVPATRGQIGRRLARDAVECARLDVAEVALREVLQPYLTALIDRYASVVHALAPRYRAELRRSGVKAVFVPFDTPPLARLLVRVAQAMDIPTLHLNDGYKADDFQREGFAAGHALAWSEAIRDNYYDGRRGNVVVTGNPKADAMPQQIRASTVRKRVLIGSFTFSPIDLNCRRSDPESFLALVLEGIRRSSIVRPRVTVKLHPADEGAPYSAIIADYADLEPTVISAGDVTALFEDADVYITTYSTSLLEAVAVGVPVVYFRVNNQRLLAPFSDDDFMEQQTATSAAEIATLLDNPPPEFAKRADRRRWCEQYLGPLDGRSVQRVLREVEKVTSVAATAT
jgi:hypothetical protein